MARELVDRNSDLPEARDYPKAPKPSLLFAVQKKRIHVFSPHQPNGDVIARDRMGDQQIEQPIGDIAGRPFDQAALAFVLITVHYLGIAALEFVEESSQQRRILLEVAVDQEAKIAVCMDDVGDRHARGEGAVRVLEYDLHVAAER